MDDKDESTSIYDMFVFHLLPGSLGLLFVYPRWLEPVIVRNLTKLHF